MLRNGTICHKQTKKKLNWEIESKKTPFFFFSCCELELGLSEALHVKWMLLLLHIQTSKELISVKKLCKVARLFSTNTKSNKLMGMYIANGVPESLLSSKQVWKVIRFDLGTFRRRKMNYRKKSLCIVNTVNNHSLIEAKKSAKYTLT